MAIRVILLLLWWGVLVAGAPEQGLWHLHTTEDHEYIGVKKSMFKNTRVNIKVMCSPADPTTPPSITITWILWRMPCFRDLYDKANEEEFLKLYYNSPMTILERFNETLADRLFYASDPATFPCDHNIILSSVKPEKILLAKKSGEPRAQTRRAVEEEGEEAAAGTKSADGQMQMEETTLPPEGDVTEEAHASPPLEVGPEGPRTNHPVAVVPKDGMYLLVVHTDTRDTPLNVNHSYTAHITIEMKSDYGYLSAVDWPLLGFYGAMCGVYLLYGLAWLIMSALRWQELLRIQYWIGAVIFLGMLEKAVFTAEYSSVNQRGYSVPGLIIFAELVSCAKRTLARMLVIIVSLGFGIVKPRLGIVLHRVVGVGLLYFILASVESCTRALQSRAEPQRQRLMAGISLALLESAICLWIFTALVQTTRILRLRHNLVKLSLYRHFTNTLAFALLASVVSMLWSIRYHQMETCLKDWKELWVDDAYWHVLFAILLLVIMILWRPSNNNQRFAFTPLLDEGSDADDEEETENLMPDASETMKHRNTRGSSSSSPRGSRSVEDDLKWVEENIPSSLADHALPILDSDEEIVTTKFEVSKMQ